MSSKISGVTLTWNSATYLPRLLSNIVPYVDEMLVIDEGSTDDTRLIAAEYGCRFFVNTNKFHFADKRNFGIQMAKNEWVLMLDDDEYLPVEAYPYLRSLISQPDFVRQYHAVKFPRQNFVDKKLRTEAGDDLQVRLFRHFCRWIYAVHEELVGWREAFVSPYAIVHDKTTVDVTSDHEMYAVIEAMGIDVLLPEVVPHDCAV